MADLVARSFRTAYLLTNSATEAESAVLAGIESWNPNDEPDGALFHKVMAAALRRHSPWEPPVRAKAAMWLPEELRAVLTLAPPVRRCFVLRNLAGVPAKVCAQLLGMSPNQVDEYVGAAQRCLAAMAANKSPAGAARFC